MNETCLITNTILTKRYIANSLFYKLKKKIEIKVGLSTFLRFFDQIYPKLRINSKSRYLKTLC